MNKQLEHKNSEKDTGSLNGGFPRADSVAEIRVIIPSEPAQGTERFWERNSKGRGPLKGLLQEQSEWAKTQNTSKG